MNRLCLIVTVEHAGNDVPPELAGLFRGQRNLLRSHRGYDIGALEVAERMAADLAAPLFLSRMSRLVIDLNRSLSNRAVFSTLTRSLCDGDRAQIIRRWYLPYRESVELAMDAAIGAGHPVLHLSVHSFTPALPGRPPRDFDLGLLHDPARAGEHRLCMAWKSAIRALAPERSVLLNQPYRGWTDGFTTALRKRFGARRYRGIELEANQRCLRNRAACSRLGAILAATLASAQRAV